MIRLGLSCFPAILSPISMYMSNTEAISDKKYLGLNPKYENIYKFFFHIWGVLGALTSNQVNENFWPARPHHRADICITREKNKSQFFIYGPQYEKQGNSVARDLPQTGSEANTTIFVIYILDIDPHCPYLLSGETTFQLTSC